MKYLPIAFSLMLCGCIHDFFSSSSLNSIEKDVQSDAALTEFYQSRVDTFFTQYYTPNYQGNVTTERSSGTIAFSDQTVFLGYYIGWQSLLLWDDNPAGAVAKIEAAVDFILNELVQPTVLPGSALPNTGYFTRDHVTFTSIVEGGVTYKVTSDSQNPSDNEMSQDQVIHLLEGYYLAHLALEPLSQTSTDAARLLQKIKSHADNIGTRLKAYNYVIVTPAGQPTKRGSDARPFAWPIAQSIANITGKSLDTYLTTLLIPLKDGKSLSLSQTELYELYKTAIDLILTGICNIKIGDDKHELCNRFTLSLVNNLYVTSEYLETEGLYIARMDRDGDFFDAALAKLLRGQKRLPDTYLQALQSAVGTTISSNTAPPLWCYMSRWIFMPITCPQDGGVWNFNGLDFLSLYQAMKVAPALNKNRHAP